MKNMFSAPLKDVEALLGGLQKLVQQVEDEGGQELHGSQCAEAARIGQKLGNIAKTPGQIAHEFTMMPYIITATHMAIDLHVFKNLSAVSPRAQTARELAHAAPSKVAVSPDFIIRSMRLLTLYGLANETDYATYTASATTHAFAAPDEALQSLVVQFSEYYAPVAQHSASYFAEKGYVLPQDERIGPFQSFWKTDLPTYEYWSTQPPVVLQRLNKCMKAMHSLPWYDWLDLVKLFQSRLRELGVNHDEEKLLLVDLGGGRGVMVHSLRSRLDDLGVNGKLILEERPPVVKEAINAAAALGFSEKTGMPGVDYLAHDFFEPQPPQAQGSLYYYASYILHNHNDENSMRLLKHVAKAMKPGHSRLLINERVLEPTGNDVLKAGLDFHMAYSHGSKERTLAEYEELVKAAGMVVIEHHRSPDNGQDIVECALAGDAVAS